MDVYNLHSYHFSLSYRLTPVYSSSEFFVYYDSKEDMFPEEYA